MSRIVGYQITQSYLSKDNDVFFDNDLNLIEWLLQYAPGKGEPFARSFLGRMLFTGDEATKKVRVLSGREKVRCMCTSGMPTATPTEAKFS